MLKCTASTGVGIAGVRITGVGIAGASPTWIMCLICANDSAAKGDRKKTATDYVDLEARSILHYRLTPRN